MSALRDFSSHFVKFSDEEWEYAENLFTSRILLKGQFFVKKGRICGELGFLVSGILRDYFEIDRKQLTRFFSVKNCFVTALPSFISQTPTRENIVAVTQAELLVISYQNLEHLYDRYPSWQKLGRLMMQQSQLQLEERLYSMVAETAEMRYRKFAESQPELIREVPLQYVASMLGMKPETLSRVRKKMSR